MRSQQLPPWNAVAAASAVESSSAKNHRHFANSDQVHGKAAASQPHSKALRAFSSSVVRRRRMGVSAERLRSCELISAIAKAFRAEAQRAQRKHGSYLFQISASLRLRASSVIFSQLQGLSLEFLHFRSLKLARRGLCPQRVERPLPTPSLPNRSNLIRRQLSMASLAFQWLGD